MRPKSEHPELSSERIVKNTRRASRKRHSAEEKIPHGRKIFAGYVDDPPITNDYQRWAIDIRPPYPANECPRTNFGKYLVH